MKKGIFITFEGPEGIGKTTQAKALFDKLRRDHLPVILSREPGGTQLGEKIRDILLHFDGPMDIKTETILFQAARVQHIEELIKPAIKKGQIVICDRFMDSTLAYQCFGKGLSTSYVGGLHDVTTDNFLPDLTLVMDGTPHRSLSRDDNYERMPESFHEKVRKGFISTATNKTALTGTATRFVMIDANEPIDDITNRIYRVVRDKLQVTR